MKKIYFAILALIFSFAACSLDETPIDQLPENEAYKTPKLVYINAVAGLYNDLRSLGGQDRNIYDMNTFTSDEAILPTRGGDWYDGGLWQALFKHEWIPSTDLLVNGWENRFTAIGKCNQSIDIMKNLKVNNPSATYLDDYIAEVRALRALSYFYLLDNFARVPVVTSSSTPVSEVKQSKRSEVFAFVKKELEESLPLLETARSNQEGTYYGRMTKATAYFLLAKLALNSKVYSDDNWEVNGNNPNGSTDFTVNGVNIGAWEAVKHYCALIEAEGYELAGDYSSNFTTSNESSIENIFVIPMDPSLYRTANYNTLRTLHYIHGTGWGMSSWNGASATLELLAKFGYNTPLADPRLEKSFYTGKVVGSDGNYILAEDKVTLFEYLPLEIKLDMGGSEREKRAGARWAKYQIDRLFQGAGEFVHNDYVLFRYADVILMQAEAEMRLGNSPQALTLVNDVRDRVGATHRTSISLNDILDERMLELSWEGWRRNDMIRFGTFNNAINNRAKSDPYRIVFPIPQKVINSNSNLTQNPVY